ncbi:unnamed protein product [Parnassius apollo]|uniref:(apollo) hypothetical protein n=1 Tax=Parnassius apollo TaxID=110799 RepID=A0A8S3X9W5_PARAO|nr:unnamed protein product [Parnassius apollo]
MNNFPELEPVPNLKFIDLEAQKWYKHVFSPLSFYEIMDSRYLHLTNLHGEVYILPDIAKSDCENLFKNENAKANLEKGNKYDVIFVEQFSSDCGLAYAAVLYDAPIIGITSHVLLPWAYPRLGLPFDFSSDAYYFSKSGPNPGLYHKVEAVLMDLYFTYGKWLIHRNIYNVFERYLPSVTFDIEKVAREKMKMVFSYQHLSVTGARPSAPPLLEIGGIHIGEPKPVPKDIEDFLANATNGAIYVSFGSNLIVSSMTPEKLQQFLQAFKMIPQKVLMKLENTSLPAGNDNIYASSWLPQFEILCKY